jgi:hypothetical protein
MSQAKGGTSEQVSLLRERLTATRSPSGFHPSWPNYPVMPDEPLWAISVRESDGAWSGWYRTATRDLDEAIAEAHRFSGVSAEADTSVLPTIP